MSKILNEYSHLIPAFLLAKTPKAVFAAILVSEYLNRLNISPDDIGEAILAEWQILYENGVIPQKPTQNAKS